MASGNGGVTQLEKALRAIQQLRARIEAMERARTEPVAIVGMGCRLPGADSPEALWRLLMEGIDPVTEVPPDRWDAASLYAEDARAPGRMNTRWGGFLRGVDRFDATFFGISPREAERMDPQQRLLLEVAFEALEDAGLPLDRLAGSAGGVFIGVQSLSNDYTWLQLRSLEGIGTHTCTGTTHSILANRLSYWLDLRGPSLAVDTACSSSLVALHLACMSLRTGECDIALAGGVNLMLSPEASVTLSKLRIMAADGRCKTFDARADGIVRGEGCALVVLKRLSDARAAGDPILALVVGSAVNQDGATNGLTAPSGLSQQLVVRRALAAAGLDPARVGFVETHGTGTALGDPIEVEALAEVLGRAGNEPCALGAVKTNIGHLEAAAGIAGVVKTVLALRKGVIPPNLHFQALSPHISLEGTRFVIPTRPLPWSSATERLAGVSAFGIGGTNAHVVLQDAPVPDSVGAPDGEVPSLRHYLLPVSARSGPALRALGGAYGDLLAGAPPALRDLCHTAGSRRTHHEHRLALVGESAEALGCALREWLRDEPHPDVFPGRASDAGRGGVVFVFSGQGAQWAGMGRGLLDVEPAFRARLEEADRALLSLAGWSLLEEIERPAERSRLTRTEFAQPVLFALQIALAELLRTWGVLPDAVVGHSVGEVAAAWVAGVLDLEDGLRVVRERGRLMEQATGGGAMAAIGLPPDAAEELLAAGNGRLSLGAVNAPAATVLTGEPDAVRAAVALAVERGALARVLPVPYAFHSSQMEPFQPELVRSLAGLRPGPPRLRVYSGLRGGAAGPGDFDAAYWARTMREPVLFGAAVAAAALAGGTDFVEIGPHPLLTGMIEQCLEGAGTAEPSVVLATLRRDLPERHALLRTAGALYARGRPVDWGAVHQGGGAVVPLPGHPWNRQRHWFDPTQGRRRGPSEASEEEQD